MDEIALGRVEIVCTCTEKVVTTEYHIVITCLHVGLLDCSDCIGLCHSAARPYCSELHIPGKNKSVLL